MPSLAPLGREASRAERARSRLFSWPLSAPYGFFTRGFFSFVQLFADQSAVSIEAKNNRQRRRILLETQRLRNLDGRNIGFQSPILRNQSFGYRILAGGADCRL